MEEIKLSFEEAMAELAAILDELEKGELPLAAAITKYERGARLARYCEAQLQQFEQKISMLTAEDGQIKLSPLKLEEE